MFFFGAEFAFVYLLSIDNLLTLESLLKNQMNGERRKSHRTEKAHVGGDVSRMCRPSQPESTYG